jgi:phenylalanyl-tRNA synthetase beta chain
MANPEDLTEEILRVVGYDTVKPMLPISMPAQPDVDGRMVTMDRTARKAMAAAGFYEVITYSFIGTRQAEELANGATLIHISNPLAQTDMVTMRPSLLAGLLKAAAQNTANGEPTPRLAEVGKVFTSKGERLMAAGLLLPNMARHWKKAQPAPDAYTAKAAALQVLTLLGAPLGGLQVEAKAPAHYHPGRSGTLRVGPFTLAHFGELHPAVAKAHGLKGAMVFELELEPLLKLSAKARTWQTRPYPPVLRDLAFVLPHDVTAQALLATVQGALPSAARALLQSVDVFDKYVGERIPAGMQSMALALVFQSPEKTLTEADITPLMAAITTAVKEKNKGELRA